MEYLIWSKYVLFIYEYSCIYMVLKGTEDGIPVEVTRYNKK